MLFTINYDPTLTKGFSVYLIFLLFNSWLLILRDMWSYSVVPDRINVGSHDDVNMESSEHIRVRVKLRSLSYRHETSGQASAYVREVCYGLLLVA